jgi:hypothetical protein
LDENPRFITRAIIDGLRREFEAQQAAADDLAVSALRPGAPAADPVAQQRANITRSSLGSSESTLAQQLDDEAKLFDNNNSDPIALLPVRLETVWWTESGLAPDPAAVAAGSANPATLRVRVYPDDLQLAHLDPQLTATEARAAAAYWLNPGPAAWTQLEQTVRPDRIAWVARATRPGAPPPVVRTDDAPRPPRAIVMPDRWRFIGFVDGQVVTDQTGLPIPDPLPLDILESQNSWTTSWFEAVLAGMAIELDLHGADHLDELIVIGIREEPARVGAQVLRDLLHSHAFSVGLGLMTAGTPTNNTPESKSGWSSGSSFPPPGADPLPGERPVADALADALGLPEAAFLRSCSGAADAEPSAVAALSMLTWAALGRGFTESALTRIGGANGNTTSVGALRPWRKFRDHLLAHVRSRGPLPMIRIGRQPYGVLPVSSLSDWHAEHAEDVDPVIADWCLRLREKWRGVLKAVPHIGQVGEVDSSDALVTGILERQATATGLAMRRMNGPAVAVPRTAPGTRPGNLSLGGLDADSALRWTTTTDAWTDLGWHDPFAEGPDFVARMTQGHQSFSAAARRTADYFKAVRTFLAGGSTAGEFHAQWPVLLSDGETPVRDTTFFDLPWLELQVVDWGDGAEVPATGANLVIVGTDRDGLLHIRIFDPDGTRTTDAVETEFPGDQDIAIRELKERLPDLLPSPELTNAERKKLFDLVASIVGQAGLPTHVLEAIVCFVNWALLEDEDDPLRSAIAITGDVDQIVSTILDTRTLGAGIRADDPRVRGELREQISAASRSAAPLVEIEAALRTVAAVPLPRIAELVMEVIDVYSHRLDAWVTSLASRRLSRLRESGTAGVRFGCYGWVENLKPMQERQIRELEDIGPAIVSQQDGYIHAPSLQQATSAAVLRSGSLSHPGEDTYSVNLNSRRARIARWLIGGVRQGQNLGTLLGYRFERALHDAELDVEIERFRKAFPVPVVPEPAPGPALDGWLRSTEAIAVRNVVDGIKLLERGDAWMNASEPNRHRVKSIAEDLADALDAVGDLLLAESVHQLVAGNPLRAGLAADTLGRGGEVPDAFHTLTTPHRARPLTHRLAALLPATAHESTGWPTDPLARLLPDIEAWIAHLLGPAAEWTLAVASGASTTVDRLNMGALATVLSASAADPAELRLQFIKTTGTAADEAKGFTGAGWMGLRGLSLRIRSLLANAQPVMPAHVPNSVGRSFGVSGIRERLIAFAAEEAVKAHPGGPALASVAAAFPVTPPDPPAAPPVNPSAAPLSPERWLALARTALCEVLGAEVPLLPTISGAVPASHPAATGAKLDAFLQRYTSVRAIPRTLFDTLLLAGVRSRRSEILLAAQDPASAEAWIGEKFGAGRRPHAESHLIWHQPLKLTGAFTGLLFDEWVELLPGATHFPLGPAVSAPPPESELTGVGFHYDRPDAKAPHALLIAVPPNLERGWTPDTLVQVLRETLELGKLRAVDLQDLPMLGDLLPAIRIASNSAAGNSLARIENPRPRRDENGPFRLEPNHRTPARVSHGLAARVHDPLWMLTRQWQFGEFAAQDAASPAIVTLEGRSEKINAWRPAAAPGQPTAAWISYNPAEVPLDVVVESEPLGSLGLRIRAEGGAHFRAMLAEKGLLGSAGPLLAGLQLETTSDGSTVGLVGALAGSGVPDAAKIAQSVARGSIPAPLAEVAREWAQWWDAVQLDHRPDCLDEHRFEYAVELSVGGSVLRASEYLGDGFDWYCLDLDSTADGESAAPTAAHRFSVESIPSVVRYGGLPADRFWEMEDARIDLGATDVSTLDTGRVLLISFATVYGNDWFLTPLEVPVGSLTVIEHMRILDVFERPHLIKRAGTDEPSWSMYTLHSDDVDHWAANSLLMMPCTQGLRGEPLELIRLTRDELANLAWAVQHRTTDDRGERVDCRDEWLRKPRTTEVPLDRSLPLYRVQTAVPDYWFPLVPVQERPGVIHFSIADMVGQGSAPAANGRLINPELWLHEEEIPREGASVLRRPVLARWFDGSWHSWVRREKSAGSGESSSGLLFDSVAPTDPWPD